MTKKDERWWWMSGALCILVGASGCLVDQGFMDGQPCGPDATCAGGYLCVREPCAGNRMCPVCRKPSSIPDGDAGFDAGDSGGDRTDGGDLGADRPECPDAPPACKTLPDCQDTAPRCESGAWICDTGFETTETLCDGVDNDCDGLTDQGLVCLLAGTGTAGFKDGPSTEAQFTRPRGLAAHASGGVLVADRGNHAIRLVAADGSVSTLAGTGHAGADDGPAAQATFREPVGLLQAGDGSILVADSLNDRIRRIGVDQVVSTEAGGGTPGFADGPAAEALFAEPSGLALTGGGDLLVADTANHCLRKISQGEVTTFAGKCQSPGWVDGDAASARFNRPTDLWLRANGTLVVAEESSQILRAVTAEGQVSTLAGMGQAGFADGALLEAKFFKPAGCVETPAQDALLVADSGNNRVRIIAATVGTLLGSGASGFEGGLPLAASFRQPAGLAYFGDGRLVIADSQNHALRVVHP